MNLDLLKLDPSSEYLSSLLTLGFKSLMMYPTRLQNKASTLIDHIFTNTSQFIDAGIIYGDVADHLPTFCVYHDYHTFFKESEIISFDLKFYDSELYLNDLSCVDFSTVYCSDPNASMNTLIEKLSSIASRHIPLTTKTCKQKFFPKKPWITKEHINLINQHHKIYEKLNKNPQNEILKKAHKQQKHHITKITRKAKKEYYEMLFEANLKNAKKNLEYSEKHIE